MLSYRGCTVLSLEDLTSMSPRRVRLTIPRRKSFLFPSSNLILPDNPSYSNWKPENENCWKINENGAGTRRLFLATCYSGTLRSYLLNFQCISIYNCYLRPIIKSCLYYLSKTIISLISRAHADIFFPFYVHLKNTCGKLFW